jgi:hypothetical protein
LAIDLVWILSVDAAVRAKLEKIMASEYYTAAAIGGVQPQESLSASPEAPAVEENLAAAEGHKVN